MATSDGNIVSSKGASIFFGVCFIILTLAHLGLMLWKRSWIMVWLIIGGILEITGYLSSGGGHGAQTVQVIIAPIFIAASVYISLGGLLKRLKVKNIIPINTSFQSILFIVVDVVCFGLQIAGIVLQLINDNKTIGTAMIIGGFVLQLLSFAYFLTLVILSHKKLVRFFEFGGYKKTRYSWSNYIKVMYCVISLFLIRNIFRLVEYAQGWNGYIFHHAIFAYIFDACTMVLIFLILVVIHPAFVYERISTE